MKKIITFSFLAVFALVQTASAKIWRVNNNTGITADFTNLNAAVTSASVLAGDTIHLESSTTDYGSTTVNKKLVILGTGYFLSETAPMVANPFTQANTANAIVYGIYFNPGSKGSVMSGVYLRDYCVIQDSLVTVQRCLISGLVYFGDNSSGLNCWADTIRQNYIGGGFTAGGGSHGTYKNMLVYNNIIGGGISFGNNINNINGFFINNDFVYYYSYSPGNPVGITSANFVYQNNIFSYVNFGAYQSSNVYFNNICAGTGVPAGNSNVQNIDVSNTVYNDWLGNGAGFSSDGRYQLKTGGGNAAVGAGTINGTTIDCGAFGGPAPYILSGMPGVPSIYALTVPTQVNTGTTTMNISLSSQSH